MTREHRFDWFHPRTDFDELHRGIRRTLNIIFRVSPNWHSECGCTFWVWLLAWSIGVVLWSSCSSTFSQITLTSFSFYNDVAPDTCTSPCTNNRIAWLNIFFSTVSCKTQSETLFSGRQADSLTFRFLLHVALIAPFSSVSSPITEALVVCHDSHGAEQDSRNVIREGHSLCCSGTKCQCRE